MSVGCRILAVLLLMCLSCAAHAEACFPGGDLLMPQVSSAEPRIALVVGNSDYESLPGTPNAKNDARDMAQALSKVGFRVICGVNEERDSFLSLIKRFRSETDSMGSRAVSMFFYAGHGVQLGGSNYLIPLDADVHNKDAFESEALNLDVVLKSMTDAANRQGSRFIILDACRDNPLGKGWGKPKARFNIKGTFWVFGTGYGNYAYDGGGRNGLFTKYLLHNMTTAGATIEQVMKRVTAAVDHESGGEQVPETGGSLVRDFMFVPGQHVVIQTTYEDTPLWLKAVYWLGLVLLIVVAGLFYRHSRKTAWTRGIDLTQKLTIDPAVAEQVRRKSRLATDEIVGYVKDIKSARLLGLVTPKYDLVVGRNSNVNIVVDRETVSGQHAEIGWDGERKGFWIEDIGSTNGTWWGKGKQLEANRRYRLESGQIFYLADQNTPLVVVAHEDADK